MAEFRIIYGKKSIRYNHFEDYDFVSCRAVATRLMGVVALRVSWRSRSDRRAALYQIIHLDYSEYGIDEYREFECVPGDDSYAENKQEMNDLWDNFAAVMGGEVIGIDAPCMLRAIESALPLAQEDVDREYDDAENRDFRAYAKMRLAFMADALNCRGITSADCSLQDAIETLSPVKLSAYETINYFLMRIIDHDYDAASILTSIDRAALPDIELADAGIQTLIRCDISKSDKRKDPPADGLSFPFRCRLTTLARDSYYHYTLVIWLNGNHRAKNPLITDIKVGSMIKLSDYEAALQVRRSEFLTVFDCKDEMMRGFDPKYISLFANSTQMAVPNGWLYTAYKGDNSHVDTASYKLNDDVYGFALLSIAGELILMSNDLRYISMLDDAAVFSMYAPFISTKGRYRLDTPVFQTLCGAAGAMFEDMVEPEGD